MNNIQQITNLLNSIYGKNIDEQSMLNEDLAHLQSEISKGKFISVQNNSTNNLQLLVLSRENGANKITLKKNHILTNSERMKIIMPTICIN